MKKSGNWYITKKLLTNIFKKKSRNIYIGNNHEFIRN